MPCTGRPDPGAAPWRLGTARALAWALWLGGWLVLGALGTWATPLWLGGLLPVAVWLAGIVLGLHVGRHRVLPGATVRALLIAAAVLAAGSLAWAGSGGGVPAALGAALGWSALCVTAARVVRLARRAEGTAPMAWPAALGAAAAWWCWGDATVPGLAEVLGVVLLAGGAACLVPAGACGTGCHGGLPGLGLAANPAPAGWISACVAATMLPMMASLPGMADTCAAAGLATPAAVVGVHLAAMFLPALALQALGRQLRATGWLVLPVAAGLALWAVLPGAAGWLALSLCLAMAWSLLWVRPHGVEGAPGGARPALGGPVVAVVLLGLAQARLGAWAAGGWLLGLGVLAVLAGLWAAMAGVLQALRGGQAVPPAARPGNAR